MRIRVDLQLDMPFKRGGKIASVEGEKFWISFGYERLSTFCFQCGRLGHDEKHCKEPPNRQNPKQYNDWIRAQGNPKMGLEKSRSTSSGDRDEGNANWFEENNVTTMKLSSASMSNGNNSTSDSK